MAHEEMKCPKCKAAVSENAKFCIACGAKLKNKKKASRPKWWLIILVAIIGFSALRYNGVFEKLGFKGSFFTSASEEDEEKVKWEDLVLSGKLPRPEHKKVDSVWDNSEEELHVILDGVSEADNTAFNAACKEMGYNIDVEYSGSSIDAYNEEGYHLDTTYWSSGSLTLDLKAPMKMETIHWPQMGLAQKLPVPEAEVGKINSDRSDYFSIYVGETDLTQFNAYIDACIEKGFTKDYSRGEKYYNAYNKDGLDLHVGYEGGNVMLVYISVPDEDDEYEEEETKPVKTPKPTATPKPTKTPKPTATPKATKTPKPTATPKTSSNQKLVNGMRPDFKKAMDEYEDFFDEYVAFMKKYNKNPSDLTLLADYGRYMKEYTEAMVALEKMDSDLNDAETQYYLKVMNRINQKLLTVGF